MADMLNAKQVQDLLQIDRSTVYRMAEDGRLPAVKVGRQWRFRVDDISAVLGNGYKKVEVGGEIRPNPDLVALMPVECVQLVQDGFADALGVMIIITDMHGIPLTDASNPCGLFAALHEYPQVWQTCVDHWQEMAAKPVLTPAFTNSSLGLLCARGLIRADSSLVGMVFVGGLAPENWPPTGEQLAALALRLGVSAEILTPHLNQVYYLERAQRDHVLTLIQRIADIVSHIVSERQALTLSFA